MRTGSFTLKHSNFRLQRMYKFINKYTWIINTQISQLSSSSYSSSTPIKHQLLTLYAQHSHAITWTEDHQHCYHGHFAPPHHCGDPPCVTPSEFLQAPLLDLAISDKPF